MNLSNLFLVGKSDGKRVMYWPGLFYRALLHTIGAAVLFLAAYVLWFLLVGPRFMGILQTWTDNSFLFILNVKLLEFIAAVLFLTVVVPLLWPLFLPLDRLPDVSALPKPSPLARLVPFGLACLVTLIALFYVEENWRGKRAWERYKHQLEAQGVPLELSRFVPRPVPDDKNFAMTPFLAPLFDFKPGTQEWRDPKAVERAQNFAQRIWSASRLVSWRPLESKRVNSWASPTSEFLRTWYAAFLQATNPAARPKPVTVLTNVTLTEAAAGVLAGLSELNPVIEELRAASRRPYSRFNLAYDVEFPMAILLPHLSPLKNDCEILQLRALAELALGRNDAAFEDLRMILDLADALRDEPLLMSYVSRCSELRLAFWPLAEGLAGRQWSEAQVRAVQDRLQRLDLCGDAKRVLEAERVLSGVIPIDSLRRSADKDLMLDRLGVLSDSPQGKNIRVCAAVVPAGWFYFEQLNFNRLYQDYVLPIFDVTKRQITPAATRKLTAQLETGPGHSELSWFLHHELLFHGIMRNLWQEWWEPQWVALVQTGLDAATLACALDRYRLAHGQYPDSLNALMPQFLEKIPHDLINGQPLNYRRTQDGQFVLYSVGWNQTDDGGSMGHRLNTGDWVWRYPETHAN